MKNIVQKKNKTNPKVFSISNEIGLLAITIFISAVIIMLIRINFNIHMDHLNFALKQQSIIDSDASSINLFARFVNQKRLYNQLITRTHFDTDEAFLMFSTVDNFRNEFSNILPEYDALEKISIEIINSLRRLTGRPPLPSERDLTVASMISHAKHYVHQKNYPRAVVVYSKIIEKNINDRLTAAALLNRALCFAFMGNFTLAEDDLNRIIKNYPTDHTSVTASVLIKYLSEFSREKEFVLQSHLEDVEKGKRLSNLLQFELALSILDTITPRSREMEAKINYYRGISYEELGKKEQAAKSYIKSIEKGGVSEISKIANRRLFMVGSQFELEKGKEIRKISEKINTVLNDESLNTIQRFIPQSIAQETGPVDEILETLEFLPSVERSQEAEGALQVANLIASVTDGGIDSIMHMLEQQKVMLQKEDFLEALDANQAEVEKINVASTERERSSTPEIGDRVIVETKDNRAFIGQILSDPKSPIIRLQTLIGLIGIQSSDIKNIQRMGD